MQLFALATVLLTTGLSVTASPYAMPLADVPAVADPVVAPAHPLYALQPFASRNIHGSGRRLSRKVRRHAHHHHHGQGNATVSSDAPAASETGSCTDEPADTTTIIQYTTITSGVDQPTATATDSAPAETTPADSSSSDSSTPTDSSSDSSTPSSTDSTPQPSQTGNSGVIQAFSEQCGAPNGTVNPTQTGGPNGDENWLNCGVDGDGWVPPPVTLDNLIYQDLATVLQQDGNPFTACSDYLPMFQNMSDETGVPTIFLASIALQESGCQPGVTGGAGEIGMMQLTGDKCPNGVNCYDAMTNIRIGSQYFKTTLDSNNGNLAATMGEYNGWYQGLTTTLANNYSTCAQHNNLDYLQNVFNGFLQGVSPDTLNMGIYHNTCQPGQSK